MKNMNILFDPTNKNNTGTVQYTTLDEDTNLLNLTPGGHRNNVNTLSQTLRHWKPLERKTLLSIHQCTDSYNDICRGI